MAKAQDSLMEESYSRLDAALGSAGGGIMRTPKSTRRSFIPKSVIGELDIGSVLDESIGRIPSSVSTVGPNSTNIGLNVVDSPSLFLEEVTAPVHSFLLGDPTLDLTSAAILSEDDPGIRATQVLFSEFVKILVDHPSEAQIWEELEEYQYVCGQQVSALDKLIRKVPRHHTNFTNTQRIYQQLLSERNTWRLLGSIYSERLGNENNIPESTMFDEEHPTDYTVVNQLYDTNRIIREAQIVVDWLEKNSADDFDSKFYDPIQYFGDTHIAWENTLKILKNENSGITIPLRGSRPLVTSLDPDATLRQGRNLHDLDQEDEMRLLRIIFAHIRSGQVSTAQELCIRAGQHWRAATLEGWKLHHDSNHTDASQRNPIAGNPYRDVWKAIAWETASDERLPIYERAIYGAFCGHLQSLLSICHEWQDVLWAYTRTMVDQWAEEQLRATSTHLRSLHPLPKDYPEEKLTLEGVFDAVERRPVIQKHLGKNPYHILQKYIILDDVEGLLQETHLWLNDGICPHLLRCLTHVVLFLRRIGRISQQLDPMCSDVLVACVKEAIERGDVEQVARYTSVLPVWLQVDWYARFLHNITDDHHRRHALQLAADVGLDTAAITSAVVTNIRLSSSGRDPEGDVLAETTAEDRVKISAIDWLLYDRTQRVEALRQSNALMRSFLVSRKIGATKALFNKIPADSVSVISQETEAETGSSELTGPTENIVREYFCFKTFLDAQESFTDWFDHYHQKRPMAPKKPSEGASFPEKVAYEHAERQHEGEYERWQKTLKLITKTACERLYNVMLFPEGGWLIDSGLYDQDPDAMGAQEDGEMRVDTPEPDRSHQLSVLRSIYIPQ
ncbi:hypothetical protein SK128_011021, partial [Halocaridina rubra]